MTLEQILHDPQHPLYALNVSYQAYCRAVYEAGSMTTIEARVAHCKPPLKAYYAEEKKVVEQGLYVVFITLPPPQCGYLDLQEPWTEDTRSNGGTIAVKLSPAGERPEGGTNDDTDALGRDPRAL